jgi:sensor histidine kinase regulating citrate/malate metabolism
MHLVPLVLALTVFTSLLWILGSQLNNGSQLPGYLNRFEAFSISIAGKERRAIHLAVEPLCGPLHGIAADLNAGIQPDKIETIIMFGVSTELH